MEHEMHKITDSLSPLEIKIIPFLGLKVEEIVKKTGLDMVSVLRALRFLENKGLLKLKQEKETIIDLGVNGIYYKKNHLPERTLLLLLSIENILSLEEAKNLSKLSDNEFKVSLGVLKRKEFIEIKSGKIFLKIAKGGLAEKTSEEKLIDILPIEKSRLSRDHDAALQELRNRKDIIEIKEQSSVSFELTEDGKKISGKEIKSDLAEEVTTEMIKNPLKKQRFRKYDIGSAVPRISGGKRHFVNQSIQQGRRIWLDLGFKEMSGGLVQTSFWNFDALFTAQDHPVREMQDTFFIKKIHGSLPEKKILDAVKKAHESGLDSSKGWRYKWEENDARRIVLRTHTTALSAKKLSELKEDEIPGKYFAIGKCFRNETVDWSHGFEFNQSEGIVIDPDANFRHLLGYLKEFYRKMGFEKIRITPAYFPYTEPSLEIHAFHPEKKNWLELGGAGIFRPEVTIPLLGKPCTVLAWGPGFDRLMMEAHKIKDLRELYKNDLKRLREKKAVIK